LTSCIQPTTTSTLEHNRTHHDTNTKNPAGVHHVVLERATALTQHPQAHFINHRTMEVLRHLGGGLAAAVVRQGPPLDQWRRFVYCESMTGGVLGEVDHFQGALL